MPAVRTRYKKKRRLNAKGKFAVTLCVLLIVAALFLVTLLNAPLLQSKFGSIISGIATPDAIKDKVSTFLVLGIADDENERDSTNLTDTIMLVTMDLQTKKASVLQIPRDTYIGDETPTGKVNAIVNRDPDYWDYSGIPGLSKMLNEMLQVNIDHYVTMKMDGFEQIVDSVGGVEMIVPADMELNGTEVSAGQQTLDGKQAIAVVRTRNVYDNGDLGRVETQRAFMSAFVSKCLSLNTIEMMGIIPDCFKSMNSDITGRKAMGYYKKISGMDFSNFSIMSLPGEAGTYYSPDGEQSVYEIDPNATAEMLNTYFRPYSNPVPVENLQIESLDGGYSGDNGDYEGDTIETYEE